MGVLVEDPNTYFTQWIPQRSDLLMELEKAAKQEAIPIVGPVVGNLLYLLAQLKGARRIVELGTAIGYSAIFMGNACRHNDGRLITFEFDAKMAERASRNIEKSGLGPFVTVQCQDALKGLSTLKQPVDMIFMDIEKEDYQRALPLCKAKLRPNGLLVADNTGFKDAQSFNRAIFEDPDWTSVNLWTFLPGHSPEYDGICMAVKQ